MNTHHPDAPFEEVFRAAKKQISEGHLVFQKWTCSACGERITMTMPNVFHKVGTHEDCKSDPAAETDLIKQGCNYMIIQSNTEKGQKILAELLRDNEPGQR